MTAPEFPKIPGVVTTSWIETFGIELRHLQDIVDSLGEYYSVIMSSPLRSEIIAKEISRPPTEDEWFSIDYLIDHWGFTYAGPKPL